MKPVAISKKMHSEVTEGKKKLVCCNDVLVYLYTQNSTMCHYTVSVDDLWRKAQAVAQCLRQQVMTEEN